MFILKRLPLLVAAFALAIAACSDDESTPAGNGTTDTTAPSIDSVTVVDQTHIDVAFDEDVTRATAEDVDNYYIVLEAPLRASTSGGVELFIYYAALNSDGRTVSLTIDPMGLVDYRVSVTGVSDVSGNAIANSQSRVFTGTTDLDDTAPVIVYRNPGPNATGVPIGQPIVVQFSEPADMNYDFQSGGVDVTVDVYFDHPTWVLQPLEPLSRGTVYAITVGAFDGTGNVMADVSWSFTTTNTVDTTPPRVTSSTPANLATNVNVGANLSLTFSETINPFEIGIQISPEIGEGVEAWSNSGRTLTFDPDSLLVEDTQYTVTLLPSSVTDLAGNGNTDVVNIVFTTGSSLESGSFTGTIWGDPTSDFADDPTGATVIAPYPFPFTSDDFLVMGGDVVAGNNTYDILHLPDGVYYPVAALNTNGDDNLDLEKGDALGAFGADLEVGDFEPDSIEVVGGNRITGVDFALFDQSAISGTIAYSGAWSGGYYDLWIGVFDTTAFDPDLGPDYGTGGFWPYDREWSVNELDYGLADGVYYVGAYLDVGFDGMYNPGSDPAGFYGGAANPTPIRMENGSDAVGVLVTLVDPLTTNASAGASAGVAWPRSPNRAPWLKRLSAVFRQQKIVQRK